MSITLDDWYKTLTSRTVDLVGDYAGDELFIIDGNSIILDVFSNSQVDLYPGFQLLHAVYLVEQFLHRLHQRKCRFDVIFFDALENCCVPAGCPDEHRLKYLCARRLIIEHLRQNLSAVLHVAGFESYGSPEFGQYLASVGPYFVMCHDGAALGLSQSSTVKASLRQLMNWFIQKTYTIALISNLEFRDTKVMAMVLEASSLDASRVPTDEAQPTAEKRVADTTRVLSILNFVNRRATHLSQRELVTITALIYMFDIDAVSRSYFTEAKAMLLHCLLLRRLRLSERAVNMPVGETANGLREKANLFLCKYLESVHIVLESSSWKDIHKKDDRPSDLGDCIDGRLFHHVLRRIHDEEIVDTVNLSVKEEFDRLMQIVADFVIFDLSGNREPYQGQPESCPVSQPVSVPSTVLPFNHPVFDPHLAPVRLHLDSTGAEIPKAQSAILIELKTWHSRKPVSQMKIREPYNLELAKFRLQKRNQLFLTDMRRYAASLTNATSGELHPETIHVTAASSKKTAKAKSSGANGAVVAMANATLATKQAQKAQSNMRTLKDKITEIEREPDLESRHESANQYLLSLPDDKRAVMEAELKVYIVHILAQIWIKRCREQRKTASMHIVTLIWKTVTELMSIEETLTKELSAYMNRLIDALKLPQVSLQGQNSRKPSFEFVNLQQQQQHHLDLSIGMTPTEFQLVHAGPYMDRSMGSAKDARVVDFLPDEWQRRVLDQLDANRSLFVVAPTSAGKTFISFYAMKQVLQADDDGVIVYVAPTKALVNQIAAEIQARFSKLYKHSGKSVWSIHTREYRINNPTSTQILVTVPHILQIMLLNPANAKTWSPRVKRIIFDEVHCIGQSDEGVIWEQLLLLAPCPIIALSATVGNPDEFEKWLGFAQRANGHELTMIKHPHRYSDLRKFVYHPPEEFSFNGLAPVSFSSQLKPPGLDSCPNMAFVHPVTSLVDRSKGIPDDFALEPRDCLSLWKAMKKHQTAEFPISAELDPPTADVIRKVDVVDWQDRLKGVLQCWMDDQRSPFPKIFDELACPGDKGGRLPIQVSSRGEESPVEPYKVNENSLLRTTLPLLCSLHDQGALPAILFNYERTMCERIATGLLHQLEKAEKQWKSNSEVWKAKVKGWEDWKRNQEKRAKKEAKPSKRGSLPDGMTKDELNLDNSQSETSIYGSFDPDDVVDGFHFANVKKLTQAEFRVYADELADRGVDQKFIDALKRGIGVHHAGMNRKYRQVCEILFRKGYLTVVIATGTLALGINMPCKTVVFSGDSIWLTALSFRQAGGRAGRRGFDVLGNVVFQGISHGKMCRLLSSRLPDLNGHFPITTSLVLRLMILLSKSGQSAYAQNAANSLLSSSRLCLGGDEARHTILHHLRFSIEYLRRNNMLDANGNPLGLANAISHLYYTENSSFAFHALFSNGYFHSLCKDINIKPDETLLELMLVMSHVFKRHPLAQPLLETLQQSGRKKSPSVVMLPPLPSRAREVLQGHNRKTLDIYAGYVSTFVDQHVKSKDNVLPLSCVEYGGSLTAEEVGPSLKIYSSPTRVNSAFVALSGHRDGQWKSVAELCDMVRSGVWLEKYIVPYVGDFPAQNEKGEDGGTPLNAYLYDFYRHGNLTELSRANGIRFGDVWFLLNDFSLILSSIVLGLEEVMGFSSESVDLLRNGEDEDEDKDEDYRPPVHDAAMQATEQPLQKTTCVPVKKSKAKVVDSWEDDMSDGSEDEVQQVVVSNGYMQENDVKAETNPDESLVKVLQAFTMLSNRFNEKFRAIYA